MQHLLQILAGHPVVQVSHMDFCPIRERLWTTFRTWATGGSQKRGGPTGHAGGCAPLLGQKKTEDTILKHMMLANYKHVSFT